MTQELVRFSIEPKTFDEMMKYAELIAKSSLVPRAYQGKPGDILIAIQMGQEVGLKPLQALQNISCINGRPCIWGDAPLALVRNSGLLEDFREDFNEQTFTSTCQAKRKGQPSPIIRTYGKVDAEKAKLWNKEGTWQTNPKRMTQLRARAFTLRDGFSDVLQGLIIGEEQEDVPTTNGDALPAPPAPPSAPKRLSDTAAPAAAPYAPVPAWRKIEAAKREGSCLPCQSPILAGAPYYLNAAGQAFCEPCYTGASREPGDDGQG